MRIKLVGALPEELRDMGFKPGEKHEAWPSEKTRLGAVEIQITVDGAPAIATVYPENFVKA
jgi:hypothetical protein